jgi:hypothetical protein
VQPLDSRHSYRPYIRTRRKFVFRIWADASPFCSQGVAFRRSGMAARAPIDGFVACPRVVGPVTGDLTHSAMDLPEQLRQHQTVVDAASRYFRGHNFLCRLVNAQMQLSPGSSPAGPILLDVPFISAIDLEPGRINHNVSGSLAIRRGEPCRRLTVL